MRGDRKVAIQISDGYTAPVFSHSHRSLSLLFSLILLSFPSSLFPHFFFSFCTHAYTLSVFASTTSPARKTFNFRSQITPPTTTTSQRSAGSRVSLSTHPSSALPLCVSSPFSRRIYNLYLYLCIHLPMSTISCSVPTIVAHPSSTVENRDII